MPTVMPLLWTKKKKKKKKKKERERENLEICLSAIVLNIYLTQHEILSLKYFRPDLKISTIINSMNNF